MGRETQGQAGEKKLERYGVWIKVEPREVSDSLETESSFELTDLEAPAAAARGPSGDGTLTVEEEKLLDELDTELGPSEGSANLSIPEEEPLLADEEELPDISELSEPAVARRQSGSESDDELPELELEEEAPEPAPARAGKSRGAAPETGEVEVTLSESTAEDRFEDLDALEDELASATSSASEPRGASSEILTRIEEELKSIRTDLTELRNELSGLRKAGGEAPIESPRSGAEAQSGFFDEDEDETIALTGDELDNILNTAEITEEAAEAPKVDEPEIALESVGEGVSLGEDVLSIETPEIEEGSQPSGGAEQIEELPVELELEDLGGPQVPSKPATADLEGLPELDLEGIPEIESAPGSGASGEKEADLETLDLEEEPAELEALPEGASDLELVEEPQAASAKKSPGDLAEDVDLEALAAEAKELESEDAAAPVEDLDLGELEAVTEEPGAGAPEEIEIDFEEKGGAESGTSAEEALLEPVEELPEALEGPSGDSAKKTQPKEGTAAIPDDLKDEIRTVLKYMDHLLEALPDEKIQEFASSDYFVMYKKLFEDLGLGE